MKVEVIRSTRRRRTVQARQVGDVLRISIPAAMTKAEEERWADEMVRRMERKVASGAIDLEARAATLAGQYGLGRPQSVRWVDNQQWRWGSCTPSEGTIRLSSRLAREPGWVIDYVLVHELAHLTVRHHNADFWKLVHRYPLTERARGFLLARGLDSDMLGMEDEPPGWGGSDPGEPVDAGSDPDVMPPVGRPREVAAFEPSRPVETPPGWSGSLF